MWTDPETGLSYELVEPGGGWLKIQLEILRMAPPPDDDCDPPIVVEGQA